ncbi:MAG: hypothetical protein HOK35_07015 [Cytophagia bacterium]|nr:hypothetical protein [Cytophagia bacterium]
MKYFIFLSIFLILIRFSGLSQAPSSFLEYNVSAVPKIILYDSNHTISKKQIDFGQNIIGLNIYGLLTHVMAFNYERISKTGLLGTKFTFYKLLQDTGYGYFIDMKYYLNGQKILSPYCGGGFEYASLQFQENYFDAFGIILFIGAAYHPKSFINFSADFGPVWGQINNYESIFMFRIGLDVGLRF